MIEEDIPNPDEILKAVQKQEQQMKLGKLKIFFGMSAGVGKTYSMLQESHERLREGIDVVAASVNTHGRKETEKLLEGLPILPEKWMKYKDMVFEELDLDAILQRHPQLVLIDELAHTNVPGSKHPKRWQDVIEILDAGIDVYTTLNVQHIESRKDTVESLTGIQIRETVPDIILERATDIELIDIPPLELLQRLKEGKVYLGDQSLIAAQNFFQEANLMALREIALRFTAEKVDHDLHGILQGKGWKTRERLMVAISCSPSSEQLIRSARRLAFELDAPWIAVYVDTGRVLNDQDQARLNRYFNLARELGAEVISTHDLNVAAALQRVARQNDITRIIIGRPPKHRWHFWNFFQESFIEKLENENKHIDIVILRQEKLFEIYQRSILPTVQLTSTWKAYGSALGFVVGLTVIGKLLSPWIGYLPVGFIFLIGILSLSFFVGQGPIFFAAALSALSWDFLFIPPPFSFPHTELASIALVVTYFLAAAIVGVLTSRLRNQEQFMQRRVEKTRRLFEIERDITSATNLQSLRLNVNARLEAIFPGKFDILIKGGDNLLVFDSSLPILANEKEQAAAMWVFQNGKIGGWLTDTLPSSQGLYFPIMLSLSKVGVLAYQPKGNRPLSVEEINFLQSVTKQLGIFLERYIFEERLIREDYSRQIERLHSAIFHSLNRSFYIPLEQITAINHQLKQASLDPSLHSAVEKMEKFIANIKLTVDNIIAISEIESGFMHFSRKTQSLKQLVDKCLEEVNPFLNGHPLQVQIPPIFLPYDFHTLKLALKNLLINAIEYSPSSQPVSIHAQVLDNDCQLSVTDQGPGISDEIVPLIFEKFYRVPGTESKGLGLGLGLAIVKAVIDIHQGNIVVQNLEGGGTQVSLLLPLTER